MKRMLTVAAAGAALLAASAAPAFAASYGGQDRGGYTQGDRSGLAGGPNDYRAPVPAPTVTPPPQPQFNSGDYDRGGDIRGGGDFRGRPDGFGGGGFARNISFRIDATTRNVWQARQNGAIDGFTARRITNQLQYMRAQTRDGVSPWEARDISMRLDHIEHMISGYDGRGHRGR